MRCCQGLGVWLCPWHPRGRHRREWHRCSPPRCRRGTGRVERGSCIFWCPAGKGNVPAQPPVCRIPHWRVATALCFAALSPPSRSQGVSWAGIYLFIPLMEQKECALGEEGWMWGHCSLPPPCPPGCEAACPGHHGAAVPVVGDTGDTGSGRASPCCPSRPTTVFSPGLSSPCPSYQGPAGGDGCKRHTGGVQGIIVSWGSGWTLISLVLSPVELLCHPCPSALACSPRLAASSIFPMLIASHNDVTLMSPCYLGPGPFPGGHGPGPCRGCAQLVHAVSCCSLVPKSHCPSVRVQAPWVRFCRATHAMSGPASAVGCSPPSVHLPKPPPGWEVRVGLSITPVGSGGAASPPLEFWCSVAEHPSLPASA